jgi:hypothetical protein
MLLVYFPLLVLDAIIEMHRANLSMWQLARSEPIIILMEADPPPAAIAA